MRQYFKYEDDGLDDYDIYEDRSFIPDSECYEENLEEEEHNNLYFQELKNIPKLNRRAVKELYRVAMQGDRVAYEELVKSQLNMVVEVASHYRDRGVDFDDLVQEGNMALLQAIRSYDNRSGFSTYLRQSIYQHLSRYVENIRTCVRIPSHMYDAARQVDRARNELVQLHMREPSTLEIAEQQNISYDEVLRIYGLAGELLADDLDIGFRDEYFEYVIDTDAPSLEESIIRSDLRENIKRVLRTLTPREEKVLSMRFGLDDGNPKTLEEVARYFVITRERIRQIEEKALRKMRHPSRKKTFESYLSFFDNAGNDYEQFEGFDTVGIKIYTEIRNHKNESKANTANVPSFESRLAKQENKIIKTKETGSNANLSYNSESETPRKHFTTVDSWDDFAYSLCKDYRYTLEYTRFSNYNSSLVFWCSNHTERPISLAIRDYRVDGVSVRYYKILDRLEAKDCKFYDFVAESLIKHGRHYISLCVEILDERYDTISVSEKLSIVVDFDSGYTYLQ